MLTDHTTLDQTKPPNHQTTKPPNHQPKHTMSKRKCDSDQPATKQARLTNVSGMTSVSDVLAVLDKITQMAQMASSAHPAQPAQPVSVLTDIVNLVQSVKPEPVESVGSVQPDEPDQSVKPVEPVGPVEPSLNHRATQVWLSDPDAAALFPASFVPDKQLVLQHFATDVQAYTRLPLKLAKDQDVITKAVETDATQIDNVMERLLGGRLEVKHYSSMLYPYSQSLQDAVRQIIVMATKTYPQAAKYVTVFEMGRQSVAKQCVAINAQAIQYLPMAFRTCELVMLATKTFPNAVTHAPDDLRTKFEKLGNKIDQHGELLDSLYAQVC